MIRRFVPVYLITGFIESGKTTLGLTVLGNERFGFSYTGMPLASK